MLTRWLTFTVFLAGSANAGRAATGRATLTFAPTCKVKGHPELELTLNCGDGKNTGVVQHWHTPFGDLQTPGFHSKLDPVFMHHDGSLVVPNTSILHSGLYYCLLQHTEGTTLWQYELHVGHNHNNQEHRKHAQGSSCAAFRFRRDAESEEEKQAGVSDEQFAGAVAASVLLTFVLGFSVGALTRTHVLRCLGAVKMRLSPQQRRQSDVPDHRSEVTVTTLPPMYDNQAFEMEVGRHDDSANCTTMEMTISSTTPSPPAKPQRSFRHKWEKEQETTAYLEGCEQMKEEKLEEDAAGRSVEEMDKGCDGEVEEEREFSGFYLLEDRGSQTETDEDKCSEDRGEDGRESNEEKMECSSEDEVEEAGEQENRIKQDGEEERRDEEDGGEREEAGETDTCRDSEQPTTETEDDKRGSKNQEDGTVGEPSSSGPSPGRRSRVIRLYQYNEDGQRYCHLPDPTPDDPGPAPRLKQRSLSLTRLNAIMAATSGGPLDRTETGREECEERPHFHMEI